MVYFSAFDDPDDQNPNGGGLPYGDPANLPSNPYGPGTGGYGPVITPPVTAAPAAVAGPQRGGGGGGVTGGGDFGPRFDFSAFPRFNPRNAQFNPLTLQQAQNEPGYAFAEQQGQQGIERSAAAKGVLRTGGTLKDIGTWVHDFATRNYGDANERERQRFLTNYQVEKDQFAPILSEAQAQFGAEVQRGLAEYGRYTSWNAPRGGGGGGSGIMSYAEWKRENGYE